VTTHKEIELPMEVKHTGSILVYPDTDPKYGEHEYDRFARYFV